MRFGRLYRDRLLLPLADHLVAAAEITEGQKVVDVLCDGGAAAALATQQVGAAGSVIAADYLEDSLPAASAMNHGASLKVVKCELDTLPLPDAGFDCAINLLTLGWAEPSMLDEMPRVTKPGGHIAILSFGGANPVHERILLDSVAEVIGTTPEYAAPLLRQLPAESMRHTTVRDVVRFDGAHQFWDVMTDGRAIFDGDDQQARAVRDIVTGKLEPFTAADGTIRIPIDLALLTADAS